jgi:hypothetical protein
VPPQILRIKRRNDYEHETAWRVFYKRKTPPHLVKNAEEIDEKVVK